MGYNKPCKDACEGRGEDYFWCHTIDNSWDYCSPKAVEPVIARGGRPCVGICDYMGKSYEWCNVWNAGYSGASNWWDYCGEGTEAAWKSWLDPNHYHHCNCDSNCDCLLCLRDVSLSIEKLWVMSPSRSWSSNNVSIFSKFSSGFW